MNNNGHITRTSDSSKYDEICINCHATDARGDNGLEKICPTPVKKGGMTLAEYYRKDRKRKKRARLQ